MMGEAGYNKGKSDFTFESQTQKFEAIYEEVLKMNPLKTTLRTKESILAKKLDKTY
jgi:hypothetical protein